MSRPTHRFRRVAVALSLPIAVGGALAGCSAGQITQTADQVPGVDGAHGNVGPLSLRDVVIEFPAEEKWESGSSPELGFVITSTSVEDDRLVSIEAEGADGVLIIDAAAEAEASAASSSAEATATADATAAATDGATGTDEAAPPADATGSAAPTSAEPTSSAPAETTVTVPSLGLVKVPDDAARVVIDSLKEELLPTQVLSITFTFEKAGEVTIEVPVGNPLDDVRGAEESFDFHGEPEHAEP